MSAYALAHHRKITPHPGNLVIMEFPNIAKAESRRLGSAALMLGHGGQGRAARV